MENPEYDMVKRYADIMKTMWLTFFYTPAIPIIPLFAIISLFIYYWVDKYNLIFRRTIKESNKKLSLEMIDLIEFIFVLHCFGQFWFKWRLFE